MIDSLPPRLRRAVSPYTGIVRSVEECLAATADPPLFQASCAVGGGEALLGVSLGHLTGIGGSGRTRREAAAAAVGEAIERYAASYVPRERLVAGCARDLPGAAEPERFAVFSEHQLAAPSFPYRRFTDETVVNWVEARRLPDGRPSLVPAELVFLGPAGIDGQRPIGYATSSGLACGEHEEETLARGLCEVLERDAFMITWAARLSLPRLDVGGLPALERQQELLARSGLRFAAIDLSVFHRFPVVLAVVRAPEGFPGALGVGAAAAPTIERAWWKALSEAFSCRSASAKLALLAGEGTERVESFDDHIRRYASHDHARATTFLDGAESRMDAAAVPSLEGGSQREWIASLCARVAAAGSAAYAVDVTSPDVGSLGLTVTRVLAPGLCALDVSHDARFLGGRRLYEAAAALGLRDGALAEEDLNPDPHPFP